MSDFEDNRFSEKMTILGSLGDLKTFRVSAGIAVEKFLQHSSEKKHKVACLLVLSQSQDSAVTSTKCADVTHK